MRACQDGDAIGGTIRNNGHGHDIGRGFEALYRESYSTVYSFVCTCANRNDVEDIVAEAFLKAARSIESYDPARAKFSTWVIAIARNCLASHYRKQRSAADLGSIPEEALAVPGGQGAVDDRLLADALLGCLDESERDLVLMKYRDGMRNSEISAATGVNESTVSSRLARARSKMRAALDD